ncbi:uncharacterized protein LOC133032297 [Cannabis sativa]|uniref:uncharacterized protein LOC133032297 n=1 Tax=Cannabis sativa TaxID=3483 RepID=UPI0029CA48A5|nr:uncharacterized protein LOC133032297 [Cannabis sativa]
MISGGPHIGGTTRKELKRYAGAVKHNEVWEVTQLPAQRPWLMDQPITFTEEDAKTVCFPHHDPLVIETPIANKIVASILIDNGSSVNLLFKEAFTAIGLTDRDLSPSAYNAILGRPALVDFGAVTSIRHLCLKFLTQEATIGTVKGNQGEARQCYNVAAHLPVLMVREIIEPEMAEEDELDPRVGSEKIVETMEDVEKVSVCDLDPTKVLRIGKSLEPEEKEKIIKTLRAATDVFAWCQEDMTGISPHVVTHVLNVNPDMPPVQQKRRPLDLVKAEALEKEVGKLLTSGMIRDVYYPEWLANPVLVPKPNGTWRVCIDFTDLNKACPKDCFPLPRIDKMVDATSGFKLLSFMDAYTGYNQIKMHIAD